MRMDNVVPVHDGRRLLASVEDYPAADDMKNQEETTINNSKREFLNYPGAEVMLHYNSLMNFDLLLQFIIFFGFLVFIISLSLVLQHGKFIRQLTKSVPESVTLLLVGAIMGLIGNSLGPVLNGFLPYLHTFIMDHVTIYNILIPPIILHASYDIYHQEFFRQVPSILTMAIIGTTLNTVIISIGLYFSYVWLFKGSMNIFQILTFSSLIAAVDPVAVLAVFEQVNADRSLYYLLFGEALLNDGVTFVLFEGLQSLAMIPTENLYLIPINSFLYVLASFLTAPIGGAMLGAILACASALLTKYTRFPGTSHLEPILVVTMAISAYVGATKLGWSGIVALISAGLVQSRYTFPNLEENSRVTVVTFVKSVAVTCELLVFILLGNSITKQDGWDWKFILFTVIFCYLARAAVIFFLSRVLNIFRYQKITAKWQVILFIGGLRGAIAYTMAISYEGPFRNTFIATTLVVIFITVIFNGILSGPMVKAFDLQEKKLEEPLPPRYTWFENSYILPVLQKRKLLCEKMKFSEVAGCSGIGGRGEMEMKEVHEKKIEKQPKLDMIY